MTSAMPNKFLPSAFYAILLTLSLLTSTLPTTTRAETPQPKIPDSQCPIMKFSDKGISPEVLHMKKEDSGLFFLNQTKDSLTTVELDYGNNHTHCATPNLKIGNDNVIRSIKPFGPNDFASVCFHDKGTYKLKVYGLNKTPSGSTATIIVE